MVIEGGEVRWLVWDSGEAMLMGEQGWSGEGVEVEMATANVWFISNLFAPWVLPVSTSV